MKHKTIRVILSSFFLFNFTTQYEDQIASTSFYYCYYCYWCLSFGFFFLLKNPVRLLNKNTVICANLPLWLWFWCVFEDKNDRINGAKENGKKKLMQKNLQSCSFPFFMWSMFSCCYLSFVIISQSIFILKTKIIKFRVQNVCDFRTISGRFARTIAYCIFSCASSTQQLQLIIIGNFAQV